MTAQAFTSAGRRSPLGPLGILYSFDGGRAGRHNCQNRFELVESDNASVMGPLNCGDVLIVKEPEKGSSDRALRVLCLTNR